MGDWDFLYGLEGQELIDAQSTGGTSEDWDYVDSVMKREKEKAAKRTLQRAKKHK